MGVYLLFKGTLWLSHDDFFIANSLGFTTSKTIGGARVCWVFPDCSSSNMEGYLRYSKLSYPLAVSIRDVVVLDQLGIHPHQESEKSFLRHEAL